MKLSPRCYAVTGLGYLPPWTVNAGFVVGDETTLIIDTGANATSAATLHGYATCVRPKNSLRVLNCEKHFDHIGGNSFFSDRNVPIYGHPGIRRTSEEFASELAGFNSQICDAQRRADREENVFFADTRLSLPDHGIDADCEMELGGCRVEILLTPGHTETNVSVWVPEERVLYSADCLVNGYRPNVSSASIQDWIESLARLRSLRPRAILPGHGPAVMGNAVEPLFDRVLAYLSS